MFQYLPHALGGGGAFAVIALAFWLYRTLDNRGAARAKEIKDEQINQGKEIARIQAELHAHQQADETAMGEIRRELRSLRSGQDALGSKVDKLIGWAQVRWGNGSE